MSNANAQPSQESTTLANALQAGKSFYTVNYAITGDVETDLIAGCLAVVGHDHVSAETVARVFDYLMHRFAALHAAQLEERRRQTQWVQGLGSIAGSVKSQVGAGYADASPNSTPWVMGVDPAAPPTHQMVLGVGQYDQRGNWTVGPQLSPPSPGLGSKSLMTLDARSELTPEQIAEVQRLSDQWWQRHRQDCPKSPPPTP